MRSRAPLDRTFRPAPNDLWEYLLADASAASSTPPTRTLPALRGSYHTPRPTTQAPSIPSPADLERFLAIADKDLEEPAFIEPPKTVNLVEMMPYLFRMAQSVPRMQWRLYAAVVFMMVTKAAGIYVPILFKQAVDALSAGAGNISDAMIKSAVSAIVLSGVAKLVGGFFKEAQMVVFTPLAQAVGRQVAFHTFRHLLDLDTQFHLEHKTGSLSRVLERGTRSVYMIFRSLVFTFIPTAVELVLVCALLAKAFNALVAGMVVVTFLVYVTYTTVQTMKVAEKRKAVNAIENETSAKTVDALLNFETVTLFNNAELETKQYNRYLRAYHEAGYDSEVSSCSLNAGQAAILAVGVTAVLASGILSCGAGAMTVGDVVMANALLLQLWAPLQFLGWFYRELR